MQNVTYKPRYSIIVVSLNAELTIRSTIESILTQSEDNYEIIVKDGLSRDNTLINIPNNSKIKVYSNKDAGIYDAMNQGAALANGEWLFFLNCGDTFANINVLSNISYYIDNNNISGKYVMIYGDYIRDSEYIKQPSKITNFTLFRTPINHQTIFFSKKMFDNGMRYDTNFIIRADHVFTIKAKKKGAEFLYIKYPIAIYQGGGFSENSNLIKLSNYEFKKIRSSFFSIPQQIFFGIILLFSMRKIRSFFVSNKAPIWMRRCYRKIINSVLK